MIHRSFVAAMLLGLVLTNGPATASPFNADGTYFTTLCSSNALSHRELCQSYVVTISYAAVFNRVEGYRACPPNDSLGWLHVAEQVKSWAYAHPEFWDMPLVPFVAKGLSKVFPCWG
jgi:hypothetical protein